MGAERKDTDPAANRAGAGTEPGLGPASAASDDDDAPELVDFDALHAALGDPIDYEEMPSGPALEKGVDDSEDLVIELEPATVKAQGGKAAGGKGVRTGDSSGRSSATYASARPHTIPPTRAPNEDLNAPAVIVAVDETATVPTAPPKMTVQMKGGIPGYPRNAPPPAAPRQGSSPNLPAAMRAPPSPANQPPPAAHPSSGSQPAAVSPSVSYPFTPPPFAVQRAPQNHLTMRMPDRPLNPKRQKTPTIVMRGRGPSAKQKLLAFMAALLLVTACGIAVIIWRKPSWIGLESLSSEPRAAPATNAPSPSGGALSPTSTTSPGSTSVPSSTALASAGATGSAAASSSGGAGAASGSSSAKPKPKPPAPVH